MEKKYHFVYITTNIINGKQYVGDHSTYNINDNYLGSGNLIIVAIKKYGKKNFERKILETCESKEAAFLAQEKYINEYNTLIPSGYNVDPIGGHGTNGGYMLKQSKEKISNSLKGRIPWNKNKKLPSLSEEHKKNISNSNKRLKRKLETRKKISKGLKGRKLTIEHKENIRKSKRKIYRKCIYCNYEMTYREFRRGHENKCKKQHIKNSRME
jgi:group I intron endonuclease